MRRVDIQELILHILEADAHRDFISNYQMYLLHNYLLTRNFFSDFGNNAVWRMEREYQEDIKVVAEGIHIIHIEKLLRELEANLRFSKSDNMKSLIIEAWTSVKDK
jgi:hypothetical protein